MSYVPFDDRSILVVAICGQPSTCSLSPIQIDPLNLGACILTFSWFCKSVRERPAVQLKGYLPRSQLWMEGLYSSLGRRIPSWLVCDFWKKRGTVESGSLALCCECILRWNQLKHDIEYIEDNDTGLIQDTEPIKIIYQENNPWSCVKQYPLSGVQLKGMKAIRKEIEK